MSPQWACIVSDNVFHSQSENLKPSLWTKADQGFSICCRIIYMWKDHRSTSPPLPLLSALHPTPRASSLPFSPPCWLTEDSTWMTFTNYPAQSARSPDPWASVQHPERLASVLSYNYCKSPESSPPSPHANPTSTPTSTTHRHTRINTHYMPCPKRMQTDACRCIRTNLQSWMLMCDEPLS